MTDKAAHYQANAQVATTMHLRGLLEGPWGGVVKSVLPGHLANDEMRERMLRLALVAVNKQQKLLECTQESVLQALMETAQTGLEIGGPLAEAHLVPYKVKGVMQANLIIDYKGLVKLMYQAGARRVVADVVRENDRFGFDRVEGVVEHVHAWDNAKPIGAWALVDLPNGERLVEYMTADEIEKVRQSSRAKDRGPWVDWPDEMWKKTALRRIRKTAPLSITPQLTAADEVDARDVPEVEVLPAEAPPIQQGTGEAKAAVLARELKRQQAEADVEGLDKATIDDLVDKAKEVGGPGEEEGGAPPAPTTPSGLTQDEADYIYKQVVDTRPDGVSPEAAAGTFDRALHDKFGVTEITDVADRGALRAWLANAWGVQIQ